MSGTPTGALRESSAAPKDAAAAFEYIRVRIYLSAAPKDAAAAFRAGCGCAWLCACARDRRPIRRPGMPSPTQAPRRFTASRVCACARDRRPIRRPPSRQGTVCACRRLARDPCLPGA